MLWLAAVLVCRTANSAPALPQEAYVWQRAWTEPVKRSVAEHGDAFSKLVFLAAEVSWHGFQPVIVHSALPPEALRESKSGVGLALRIGPYPGPFSDHDETSAMLAGLARSLIAETEAKGVAVDELQIDFDCADSKLAGYRQWLMALRRVMGRRDLVITTLPSWLHQPEFPALAAAAAAADGHVLQVHSLEKPGSFATPFTLCDPAAARAAVEKAGHLGIPFRVALPTYGYVLAFAPDGRFVGLSAEGPARSWPAKAKLREVDSDPVALSGLVREWAAHRPSALQGIIWYRLPNDADTLNWRWPTLNAMLQLRSPREHVRVESRRVESGLQEISLVNDGELDLSSRLAVTVHWQGARMLAGDALRGFTLVEEGSSSAKWQSRLPPRVRAGESWTIGWIRLNQDAGVTLEIVQP